MRMVKILISIPEGLKRRLDGLKRHGYTASGYIRGLLDRELGAGKSEKPER